MQEPNATNQDFGFKSRAEIEENPIILDMKMYQEVCTLINKTLISTWVKGNKSCRIKMNEVQLAFIKVPNNILVINKNLLQAGFELRIIQVGRYNEYDEVVEAFPI